MPRNYSIDYIRLLSAFGVIFIHLSPSSLPGEHVTQYFSISAVPFFLLTSVYLFQSKGARFDRINFARILIPYGCWSAIYLFSRSIKHLANNTSLQHDWVSVIFFGGAGVQLYFLPLLLYTMITASVINTLFGGRESKLSNKLIVLFSIVVLIMLSDLLIGSNSLGSGGDFLKTALYYTFFSQAVAIVVPYIIKIRNIVFFVSLPSLLLLMFLGVERGLINSFSSALIAVFILLACLMRPTDRVPKIVNTILSTTYGIYLCHHLFTESIEVAFSKLFPNFLPYSISSKCIFSSIIIMLSIIFVLLTRKSKILSLLLLGEGKLNYKILESV